MTLDKCIILQIGTLTGCPQCRESHPLCRLKNPTVISIWLLVGFHPATRSVQSTPADNTRKRVWQYIEKEKERPLFCLFLSGRFRQVLLSVIFNFALTVNKLSHSQMGLIMRKPHFVACIQQRHRPIFASVQPDRPKYKSLQGFVCLH